ncbi:MAG: hypothetical protein N3G19_01410 [Candidatus Pacearchaeota archaeon]|nr:hypothetical protein [Candidatus Pacearchaeota archaeon]
MEINHLEEKVKEIYEKENGLKNRKNELQNRIKQLDELKRNLVEKLKEEVKAKQKEIYRNKFIPLIQDFPEYIKAKEIAERSDEHEMYLFEEFITGDLLFSLVTEKEKEVYQKIASLPENERLLLAYYLDDFFKFRCTGVSCSFGQYVVNYLYKDNYSCCKRAAMQISLAGLNKFLECKEYQGNTWTNIPIKTIYKAANKELTEELEKYEAEEIKVKEEINEIDRQIMEIKENKKEIKTELQKRLKEEGYQNLSKLI